AARRQSGSLPDRRADQARQQLAQQPARRTHALGLGCRTLIGGGEQNQSVKPFRSWPRLLAYYSAASMEKEIAKVPRGAAFAPDITRGAGAGAQRRGLHDAISGRSQGDHHWVKHL